MRKNIENFLMGLLVFIPVFSVFVDGAIPTLTKEIFGEQLFIPSKVVLIASIVPIFTFALYRVFNVRHYLTHALSASFIKTWLIWAALTLLSLLFVGFTQGFEIAARSISEYYFYMFLFPVFYLATSFYRSFYVAIIALAPILVMIALMQSVLNEPIINVGAPSDKFRVMAYLFDDKVRAFSVFGSPVNYGYYVNILFSIALSYFLLSRRTFFSWSMALVAAVLIICVYLTYTRAIYLQCLAIALFVYIAKRNFASGTAISMVVRYFPILIFIGYSFVTVIAFLLATEEGIVSGVTVNERVLNWGTQIMISFDEGWASILFGRGVLQEDDDIYIYSVLIDNSYVSLFSNTGLIGLVAWIWLTWSVWRILLDRGVDNLYYTAFAAWYSTWLGQSVINNTHVTNSILVLMLLGKLVSKNNHSKSVFTSYVPRMSYSVLKVYR